jgi:hypothetical protein
VEEEVFFEDVKTNTLTVEMKPNGFFVPLQRCILILGQKTIYSKGLSVCRLAGYND